MGPTNFVMSRREVRAGTLPYLGTLESETTQSVALKQRPTAAEALRVAKAQISRRDSLQKQRQLQKGRPT